MLGSVETPVAPGAWELARFLLHPSSWLLGGGQWRRGLTSPMVLGWG